MAQEKLIVDGHEDYVYRSNSAASTDSYVTLQTIDFLGRTKALFYLLETGGSKAIKYKIQGSQDNSNWTDIQAETEILASASTYKTATDAWALIRVQIKSSAAGQAGAVTSVVTAW